MTQLPEVARRAAVVLCLIGASVTPPAAVTGDLEQAAAKISPVRVRAEINYLASDALRGRNTPSAGLDSAAEYIARAFAAAGLQPVDGSYFQPFSLNIVALGESNELAIATPAAQENLALKEDFVPFEITANRTVEAEVVFVGYGIAAPEYLYDDYAGIDVKDKIVFLLRHEPGEDDTASVFAGKKPTDYSNVTTKVKQAREHGAIGVLVATDPLNHRSLTPRGFPWPSLSKIIPADALPLSLGVEEEEKLPVVHVGERVIDLLFGSVDSLRAVQSAIDKSFNSHSFPLPGVRARIGTSTVIREHSVRNVVGVREGSDRSRRGEHVIVGAHYDHVGVQRNVAAGEDSIFNGADDNGSGTVALMEVGAALGAMKGQPRRSILLVAFAGEEKGLMGSEYYARHPLYPLDSAVAMINLDMVGRNAQDSLMMIGAAEESFLVQTARKENAATRFVLENTTLSSGGSDHDTFRKRKVPVLFFHTDLHGDYHRVTDEAALISETKIARVAALVFRTVWNVATSTESRIHPLARGKK